MYSFLSSHQVPLISRFGEFRAQFLGRLAFENITEELRSMPLEPRLSYIHTLWDRKNHLVSSANEAFPAALYVKMFRRIAKASSGSVVTGSVGHSVTLMTSRATDQTTLAASMGSLGLLILSMFLVPLRDFLGAANVAIILLLGVQVVATIGGRQGGIIGAIVAALSFDFFFTEPYLRLVITDRHDIVTAVLLLVAGVATSELGALRVRRELERGGDRDLGQAS